MFKSIRLYAAFALLMVSVAAQAQETKSFSKQMNEIKRSGDYIYAESSAPNEADAKTACDALLKIEITKYIASKSDAQDNVRIVKDIKAYNREYLVHPRGDMVRVFGYVAKSHVSKAQNADKKADPQPQQEQAPQPEPVSQPEPVQQREPEPQPVATVTVEAPVVESAPQQPANQPAANITITTLHTDGLKLARWQIDMLEQIVSAPNMVEAKKLLNRYKSQNRIKRLGDRSIANPRPTDSFFLVFGDSSSPVALLAPTASGVHIDMISGTTTSISNFSNNQYFWFQISK